LEGGYEVDLQELMNPKLIYEVHGEKEAQETRVMRKLHEGAREVQEKLERQDKGIDPSTPKMSPTQRLIHLKNSKTPSKYRDSGSGSKYNYETFVDKVQSSEKTNMKQTNH